MQIVPSNAPSVAVCIPDVVFPFSSLVPEDGMAASRRVAVVGARVHPVAQAHALAVGTDPGWAQTVARIGAVGEELRYRRGNSVKLKEVPDQSGCLFLASVSARVPRC